MAHTHSRRNVLGTTTAFWLATSLIAGLIFSFAFSPSPTASAANVVGIKLMLGFDNARRN